MSCLQVVWLVGGTRAAPAVNHLALLDWLSERTSSTPPTPAVSSSNPSIPAIASTLRPKVRARRGVHGRAALRGDPGLLLHVQFRRGQKIGDEQWRAESQPPGPPWGKALPPRKAMAFFIAGGQGVAVCSPAATQSWNFGPDGSVASDDPAAGPCMDVAPIFGSTSVRNQSTVTAIGWCSAARSNSPRASTPYGINIPLSTLKPTQSGGSGGARTRNLCRDRAAL